MRWRLERIIGTSGTWGRRARLSLVVSLAAGLLASADAPGDSTEPARPSVVGMVLPSAPDVPPGTVPREPEGALTLARQRASEGDHAGVVSALTPWLESRKGAGRERVAGTLLLGLAHMELGNWNLASAAFYRVRASDSPLSSYGAWYEATVDHKRGRHMSAASICRQYRTRWPDGPEADDCLLLIGDASAMAGQRGASLAAYQEYLETHPDTPRKEEIRLGIALATAVVSPRQAIPLLQDLVLSHSWHSTALSAQKALDELGRAGMDVALPTDIRTKMRLCESERRCGRFDEAWALFQEIAAASSDDPEAAAWVEQNEDRVAQATRRYEVYAASLERAYPDQPSGDLAWRIFVAWSREGEWARAVEWARKAKTAHPTHARWRRTTEEVAWAETLAGNYPEARALWEQLIRHGGKTGQDARFYAAFSAYRAGDLPGAEAALSAIASREGDWQVAAAYWRARTRDAAGDKEGAEADRALVRARDRHGWYRLLLETAPPPTHDERWLARDGRWHGPLRGSLPEWEVPESRPLLALGVRTRAGGSASEERQGASDLPPDPSPRWSLLRWPLPLGGSASKPPPAEEARPLPTLPVTVPDGYQACLFYDPVAARKAYATFSEANKALWPDLPASHDLALAGVYDEAARLLHAAFEEWRSASERPNDLDPRKVQMRALTVTIEDWRQFFLFARAHYQAARFCAGLEHKASAQADREAARRLAWPIVRGADLWAHGQAFDVDPLLMMGLMRQESTYQSWALSSANAVGLVQVLPSTGARVAALLGEGRYSPGDLEDPAINLRYGTYYFSLLMRRFDGVFPLAVASYNGGPHNVSRWYRGWQGKIEMDALVEQMQYPETRDYVKRVTGNYAEYVRLYADAGARVLLPRSPLGDDPKVIDF